MTIRSMARLALASAILAPAAATADYTFTSVNGVGPHSQFVNLGGINNSGATVGTNSDTSGNQSYIRSSTGSYTMIGTTNTLQATGIDAAGDTVGANGNGTGFLRLANGTVSSPMSPNSNSNSFNGVSLVNGDLTIAGYRGNALTGQTQGLVYDNTTQAYTFFNVTPAAQDPTHQDATQAFGINAAGTIVGNYSLNNLATIAGGFIRTADGTITTVTDPFAGATYFQLSGINNNGVIAGFYNDAQSNSHSFIDVNGVFTVINNPLAGTFGTAVSGINDLGQLSGLYFDASGNGLGFIATPGVVPEPTSLLLVSIGGIALVVARKRLRIA